MSAAIKRGLGYAFLVAAIAVVFLIVASAVGYKAAAVMLAMSIAITAAIVFGVYLITP